MVILTKPKCSKTHKDSKSDIRKPNFKSVLKSVLRSDQLDLSQSMSGPLDLSSPFTGFQRHLPDMSGHGLN
jgi:hypothetical protein